MRSAYIRPRGPPKDPCRRTLISNGKNAEINLHAEVHPPLVEGLRLGQADGLHKLDSAIQNQVLPPLKLDSAIQNQVLPPPLSLPPILLDICQPESMSLSSPGLKLCSYNVLQLGNFLIFFLCQNIFFHCCCCQFFLFGPL